MSRSEHNPKPRHYEWWNRRPLNCHYPSAENKRICNSIERARSKQELVKEMSHAEAVQDAGGVLVPARCNEVDSLPSYHDCPFKAPVDNGLWIRGFAMEYFQPDSQDALDTFESMSDPNAGTSYLRFLHYTLMLHGY